MAAMIVCLVAGLAGALFGFGLSLSGMVDPVRVQGFLSIGAHWDPSLAAVMAGALLPMALAWRFQAGLARPVVATAFHIPKTWPLDARIVLGAACFGVGWACSGLCPGPALVGLVLLPGIAWPYLAAMLAGAAVARKLI